MGFCTKCGRQRSGTEQFCAGCGAQGSDVADAAPQTAESQSEPRAEPAPETIIEPAPAEPAESARDELPMIEPTRWDTNWYKPRPSAASPPPAAPGQTPPGPPSYGPPSYGQGPYGQPPYQPPPHVPGTIGTPPLRRGQTVILTILLVVVLLAVGGGAYALVSRFTGHKNAAPPPGSPTVSAPAAPGNGATTPASSPAASPTGSPSPGVSVAAGLAANPAEPAIAAFLARYFTAINSHDYAAYSSLLDSREQSVNTPSTFNAGYGSTNDSAEALTAITGTGGGDQAATVSFTSHQTPAESPTKTSCTSWTITLYLQPNGGSYLIGPAPAGYHASYRAC